MAGKGGLEKVFPGENKEVKGLFVVGFFSLGRSRRWKEISASFGGFRRVWAVSGDQLRPRGGHAGQRVEHTWHVKGWAANH